MPTNCLSFNDIKNFVTPSGYIEDSLRLVEHACSTTLTKVHHNEVSVWINLPKLLEKFVEVKTSITT